MAHLFVIGGPSLDTIHIKGKTHQSPGGAGMYVAMAAARAGAKVALFGPRPDVVPDALRPITARVQQWIGPVVPLEEFPSFEIAHHGTRAEYVRMNLDAEMALRPDNLPDDLSVYDGVHIVPLGRADLQRGFFEACRKRGARFITAGTHIGSLREYPEDSRYLMENTDAFFMNEAEAKLLFGSLDEAASRPGTVLFITRAGKGALVVQGRHKTEVPAPAISVKDPTGAGETFIGMAAANLIAGRAPCIWQRCAQRGSLRKRWRISDRRRCCPINRRQIFRSTRACVSTTRKSPEHPRSSRICRKPSSMISPANTFHRSGIRPSWIISFPSPRSSSAFGRLKKRPIPQTDDR